MARILTIAIGIGLAAYGVLLLGEKDVNELAHIGTWLLAGPVLHDAVFVWVTIALCAAGAWVLPGPWRAPAVVAFIVLGTLTVAVIPVLLGYGMEESNPTLLDRPYVATWWSLVGVTVLVVAVAGFVRRTRQLKDRS